MNAPRLLWAMSHQTLIKSDVPSLRNAGIDVVPEEPDPSVLRDVDFVEYSSPDDQDTPGVSPGRRLRLWARGGRVSDVEAAAVNEHYDAIMIASRLDIAYEVRQWFHGSVLFRWFGDVPNLTRVAARRSRMLDGIIVVPIFQSLVEDSFCRKVSDVVLLRTTIPRPPGEPGPKSSMPGEVCLYLGGIGDVSRWRPWIIKLAGSVGERRIAIAGLSEACLAELAPIPENVRFVPRLGAKEYWRFFSSLDLMIYPHGGDKHSHYIPFEAMRLGIPCLVSSQGVVAGEARRSGIDCDYSRGVMNSLDQFVAALADAVVDGKALAERQKVLLAPFSSEVVEQQAQVIRCAIERSRGGSRRGTYDVACHKEVPSSRELREAMISGLETPVRVSPSSIATATGIGANLSAEMAACDESGILGSLRLRIGDDVLLRCGSPTISGRYLSIHFCLLASPGEVFAACEAVLGDLVTDSTGLECAGQEGYFTKWCGELRLCDGESIRVRLNTSLLTGQVVIHELRVGRACSNESNAREFEAHAWTQSRGRALSARNVAIRSLKVRLAPGAIISAGDSCGPIIAIGRARGSRRSLRMGLLYRNRGETWIGLSGQERVVLVIGSARGLRKLKVRAPKELGASDGKET